ncbi:polysaccharide lyase family protein [Brachybacterium sp. YJGR34]|uniref:polysaccharide lyase family protein n=1 Tax=Brachybacterium sp. YJGR34 TaxID=2059911 RepID=UPI000E0AB53D|nr:polysaccharide lyase family protein [Brachybacterium sp. YJGR34]
MSPRPAVVTGLAAEPALATITLTWDSLGFDPLIDHYRIYAVEGEAAPARPEESSLLAKTVYPRLVHDGLAPAGETWSYRILAVSDGGTRGEPSAPITAASQPSVTATGVPVATIGEFDGRTLEHRFAPSSYSRIPEEHPEALIEYRDGADEPGTAWPYLLPGPGDAWAGRTAYRARWSLTLEAAPADDHDLAVWLVDTTRLGGILRISANGEHVTDLELPAGATRGSREGDATVPGSTLRRCFFEPAIPAGLLQAGENTIELELAEGGWAAWDAVGLYARG